MSAATNYPRTWPASASPNTPNAAWAATPSSEHGRQKSIPTRPITGRGSISTIERRVRFMIVKVGDGLGETFGNIVGRLAATLAVLTPVIPAFGASVLIVHPILPDRDHAAMLTMVKDGSWFRFVHRHPSSMGFYRARASADTLKQDELRAAAGQCSEQGEREKASGGGTVDVAAAFEWIYRRSRSSMLVSRAFAVSSDESGLIQSTWVHRSLP